MDAVFCTNYPEYSVALELDKYFKKKDGYSIGLPLNRQQKGYDLLLYHRPSKKCVTVQIKGSRSYVNSQPKRASKKTRYHFGLWFNNFDVDKYADYYILFGLYPAKLSDKLRRKRTPKNWWKSKILIFNYEKMKSLLKKLKNKSGGSVHSFYIEFNENDDKLYLTRGVTKEMPLQKYLLECKIQGIKEIMAGSGS